MEANYTEEEIGKVLRGVVSNQYVQLRKLYGYAYKTQATTYYESKNKKSFKYDKSNSKYVVPSANFSVFNQYLIMGFCHSEDNVDVVKDIWDVGKKSPYNYFTNETLFYYADFLQKIIDGINTMSYSYGGKLEPGMISHVFDTQMVKHISEPSRENNYFSTRKVLFNNEPKATTKLSKIKINKQPITESNIDEVVSIMQKRVCGDNEFTPINVTKTIIDTKSANKKVQDRYYSFHSKTNSSDENQGKSVEKVIQRYLSTPSGDESWTFDFVDDEKRGVAEVEGNYLYTGEVTKYNQANNHENPIGNNSSKLRKNNESSENDTAEREDGQFVFGEFDAHIK